MSQPRATPLLSILHVHVSLHRRLHTAGGGAKSVYNNLHVLPSSSSPFPKIPKMLLKAPLPSSSLSQFAPAHNASKDSPGSPAVRPLRGNAGGRLVISAKNRPISGVVFEPFEEVKKELKLVPAGPQSSLARQVYSDQSEAAINEQINVEYNVSYVYHAMYAYFDRDNIGLKGFAKFFKESSEEERGHAEKFMEYQNTRGGKVKLQTIMMPASDFEHAEKGDALYAMELTLSLEKLNNEKLLHLHKVATENNDVQLVDFIESEYLVEQVESIKRISEYVAQLRRLGKGHGVWHFDQMLLNRAAA